MKPDGICLVQKQGQLLTASTLVMTLDRGGALALTLGGGLLVELARTQFGQQTGFLDGAFEATQCGFKRLVFFQANDRYGSVLALSFLPNDELDCEMTLWLPGQQDWDA